MNLILHKSVVHGVIDDEVVRILQALNVARAQKAIERLGSKYVGHPHMKAQIVPVETPEALQARVDAACKPDVVFHIDALGSQQFGRLDPRPVLAANFKAHTGHFAL